MKSLLKLVSCFVLILALVVGPALADVVDSVPLLVPIYANEKSVKVYVSADKHSDVVLKLKGGEVVYRESVSEDGVWSYVYLANADGTFAPLGWVKSEYMVDYIPQAYCNHQWTDWTVDVEPTCDAKGHKYRTCTVCGKIEDKSVKALGHDFEEWVDVTEATCSVQGQHTRVCKRCGFEEDEYYLKDHTYGSWRMIKDPTCSEKGSRMRICDVCGYEDIQALDTIPHDYAWKVTTEVTDHSAGVRTQVCNVCGAQGKSESFDPEGTLRKGSRGDDVRAMQKQLADQGYLTAGGVDGAFGGGTEKALKQFQMDQGLSADGVAWPQTIQRLNHQFGEWTIVKPSTRSEEGERVRTCIDCGYEEHGVISCGDVLEKGRRGEDVRILQQMLTELGFNAGTYDGVYGPKLDAALSGFATNNGFTSEAGKVRPSDLDAVLTAWCTGSSAETWMGEGIDGSPVKLALTVEPEDIIDDNGLPLYSWSVTNTGSEKVNLVSVILTYGDAPDFKSNLICLKLDGTELSANSGNVCSGVFGADPSWGEGKLNFVALGLSKTSGAKWLSNVVSFDQDVEAVVSDDNTAEDIVEDAVEEEAVEPTVAPDYGEVGIDVGIYG